MHFVCCTPKITNLLYIHFFLHGKELLCAHVLYKICLGKEPQLHCLAIIIQITTHTVHSVKLCFSLFNVFFFIYFLPKHCDVGSYLLFLFF